MAVAEPFRVNPEESHLTSIVESDGGELYVVCDCGYKSPDILPEYIEGVRNRHERLGRE